MGLIKRNFKTVISIILTTITSLYQLLSDNAELFGIDNKYIMIASVIITAITIIVNAINNGTGDTKTKRLLSYIKINI